MTNVATAVEAGKAVVETVEATAPAIAATGTLDYKKVAIGAGVVVVVGIGTYFCIKAVKKRNTHKVIIESAKGSEVNPEQEEPKAE